jgi:CMP-N-acetylneuraminate monooxygenase
MKYICKVTDFDREFHLEVDQHPYFLTRDGHQVRMFSLICPHMGGIVEKNNGFLVCPIHKWKFNRSTGKSLVGSKDLHEIEIFINNDMIFAAIESAANADLVKVINARTSSSKNISIELLAHATLDIRVEHFSLIVDPWLDGSAFHGSWTQYPPPSISAKDIRPDVLLITHEHSDHCNLHSLKLINRTVPVYFPAFPNSRLERVFNQLGFLNINPMMFGEIYHVYAGITICCFQPTSTWNDSIQLIDVRGFRILNLNDAGINTKIAKLVDPIDLICSAYGSGASGYPMCWTHLSPFDSERILQEQISAKKNMLVHASKIYKCSRILLFASYFALQHPIHEKYQFLLSKYKLNPQNIKEDLVNFNIEVLDLLPGEIWFSDTEVIKRKDYKSDFFSWENTSIYLKNKFSKLDFFEEYPCGYKYEESLIIDYFLKFDKNPQIIYLKYYIFKLNIIDTNSSFSIIFEICNSKVKKITSDSAVNLTIEIPVQLLMHLIINNLSWDEVYIGYWCLFHQENPYNVSFWRMLQAPYFMTYNDSNLVTPDQSKSNLIINKGSSISYVLEQLPHIAAKLMAFHGMHCIGCGRSSMETIAEGGRKHGLSNQDVEDLIDELNFYFKIDYLNG